MISTQKSDDFSLVLHVVNKLLRRCWISIETFLSKYDNFAKQGPDTSDMLVGVDISYTAAA